MRTITTVAELRQLVKTWKHQRKKIVLVPTMGNLHAGHLMLMKHARRCGDIIICSIFVNALQFDRRRDLEAYPQTPEQDLAALHDENVDLVFMPEHEEVYTKEYKPQQEIPKHALNEQLCGKFRPGYFDGVVEIVTRLFHIVCPDIAVFGEKDYQQLIIIKRLVQDMNFPIKIEQVATQREEDGLAYSSRNSYLSTDERAKAKYIYETLLEIKTQIKLGSRDFEALEKRSLEQLTMVGFRPEYVAVLDAKNLESATYDTDFIAVLVAAWLGKARLIDNMLLRTR